MLHVKVLCIYTLPRFQENQEIWEHEKLLNKKGWMCSAEGVIPNVYNCPGFHTLNRKKRKMVNVTKGIIAVKEWKNHKDTGSFFPGHLPYQRTHQDKISRRFLPTKMGYSYCQNPVIMCRNCEIIKWQHQPKTEDLNIWSTWQLWENKSPYRWETKTGLAALPILFKDKWSPGFEFSNW